MMLKSNTVSGHQWPLVVRAIPPKRDQISRSLHHTRLLDQPQLPSGQRQHGCGRGSIAPSSPGFLTCGLHNRETCALRFHLGSDRGLVGHTLPYLVPDTWNNAFWIATSIAGLVVFFELWAIAFVRHKYMSTPFTQAVLQIVLGGSIVLAAGILIGGS